MVGAVLRTRAVDRSDEGLRAFPREEWDSLQDGSGFTPSARMSLSGTMMVGSDQRRQERMGSAARVQMLRPLLQVRSCLWALLWLRKTIKILRTCEPMGLGHWTSHSRRCRSRKGSEHRRCMARRQPGIQSPEALGGGTLQCGHVAELRDIGVWRLGWLT